MKKYKNIKIDLFLTLLVFWLLLTLEFTSINIATGIIISIAITAFTHDYFYFDAMNERRIPSFMKLIHFLIKMVVEIYVASFFHIIRIIKMDHSPGLIFLELEIEDPLIITLIANAITMTPGTITIDIKDNYLTILTIRDSDKDREKIKALVIEKLESIFK